MRSIIRLALFLALYCVIATQPGLSSAVEHVPLDIVRHPRGRALGSYQRTALRRLIEGRFETADSLKLIVVRAEFADWKFKEGPAHVPPHDSIYYANELRHLLEYFRGGSNGAFHLDWTLAPGIVSLSRPMGYYGEDGSWEIRMAEMLMEVVEAADDDIDFSQYEAFAVIHAGPGSETDINGDSPEQVSSGFIDPLEMAEILSDTLGTPGIPTNDRVNSDTFYVDNLMIWPEEASQDGSIFGALGIYAYQVGLRLGMVPLFDTTPSGFPDSQGIGSFGLMSYGLYNAAGFIPAFPCAFHRYLMGWVDAQVLGGASTVRITDINSALPVDTALVKLPVSPAEYFIVANRVHDTNFNGTFDFIDLNGNGIPENEDTLLGAEFDFFLTATTNPWEMITDPDSGEERKFTYTGSGLMIWHIDEQVIADALSAGRYPNDNRSLKGVDLEEADGVQDLDKPGGTKSFGSYLDTFRDGVNTKFASHSLPSSMSNSGIVTGITIGGISAADSVMTFSVGIALRMDLVRSEFDGDVGDLSPIPVHLDGNGVAELVVAADTGLILIGRDACMESWAGGLDTLVTVEGASWSGPPVFGNLTGSAVMDIFISSRDAVLYAFESTGDPYPIDTDGTIGSLKLRGDIASNPMIVEADGDEPPELLVLSSDEDSTFLYLIDSQTASPGSDWRIVGNNVRELGFFEGRLLSHPARGFVSDPELLDGFFVSTYSQSGEIAFHYVPLSAGSAIPAVLEALSRTIPGFWSEEKLLEAAAGDIDGDGSDEMIIALPGRGLVYYGPYAGLHEAVLRGERPSSVALEDLNGDGILETALRDESFLYLNTGFGSPLDGWPLRLPDGTAMLESSGIPAPPVIADIDGDGVLEIVYRAGRNLHAHEIAGEAVTGWPLPGEGSGASSPAIAAGPGGELNLFIAGSFDIIASAGGWEGSAVSALSRFSPDVTIHPVGGWYFFRRDAGGSARQRTSNLSTEIEEHVDERSFRIYPNPVRENLFRVRIDLSAAARLHLEFLTLEGEKVLEYDADHRWPENTLVPFEYEVPADNFSSGIYICRLEIAGAGWSWSGYKKFAVAK